MWYGLKMTHPHGFSLLPADLLFYASPPHPCSYLPGREAATLFADPQRQMTPALYSALSDYGFRRSGDYVYRPRCGACQECLPCRIPVEQFKPDRSQRRVWKHNLDLTVQIMPPDRDGEHFTLYQRYLRKRHDDGAMDADDREQYLRFLTSSWCDTWFVLFRAGQKLVAVAVVDQFSQGLSAVYTFYDPDEEQRSLGTMAVLWQIEQAKRMALPYLYLGYYIAESRKMAYKQRFHPLELYQGGKWAPRHTPPAP